MILAHHIILTGYGHWLPNDPRGSMSKKVYAEEIAELAEIHFGRREDQPTIETLREFSREAQKRLAHPMLWFDDAGREAIRGKRKFPKTIRCSVRTRVTYIRIRLNRSARASTTSGGTSSNTNYPS